MDGVVGAIMATVLVSAFGMGVAWFFIIESKLDSETQERLEMLDFYAKRHKEDALEKWVLRRRIADLNGVEFNEPKPELEYEHFAWRSR